MTDLNLLVGIALVAAAIAARAHRPDAWLSGVCGVLAILHWSLYTGSWLGPLVSLALLARPLLFFLMLVLFFRYFGTPVRGWPRVVFLVAPLVFALPFFAFMLVAFALLLFGH